MTTAEKSDPTPVQCTVVAGDTLNSVEASEARVEAYGKIIDLLVGFRRIVRRGAIRLWGEDWFVAGCPAGVRDRLIAARATEIEMERTASDEEEPYELASFGDLADMVESSESLVALLQGLALSPDGLLANLRTLEDLRRKLAAGRVVSDSEGVVLDELHLRLREKLSGARRRGRDGGGGGGAAGATGAKKTPEAADHPEESADRNDGSRPESAPPQSPVQVSAERTEATSALFGDREPDTSPEIGFGAAAVAGWDEGARAQSTDVLFDDEQDDPSQRVGVGGIASSSPQSTDVLFDEVDGRQEANRLRENVLDGSSTPVGLVHVEPEDFQVLRDLRSEIISAAEMAYGSSQEISTNVWQSVLDSGWYSARAEAYGLAEVATFHAVVENYQDRLKAGSDQEELRAFLADCELAKLLLRLRELFIRLRV